MYQGQRRFMSSPRVSRKMPSLLTYMPSPDRMIPSVQKPFNFTLSLFMQVSSPYPCRLSASNSPIQQVFLISSYSLPMPVLAWFSNQPSYLYLPGIRRMPRPWIPLFRNSPSQIIFIWSFYFTLSLPTWNCWFRNSPLKKLIDALSLSLCFFRKHPLLMFCRLPFLIWSSSRKTSQFSLSNWYYFKEVLGSSSALILIARPIGTPFDISPKQMVQVFPFRLNTLAIPQSSPFSSTLPQKFSPLLTPGKFFFIQSAKIAVSSPSALNSFRTSIMSNLD